MSYYSPSFIFFVLAGLVVFNLFPVRWRKWWLLVLSFAWYASWGLAWGLAFLAISTLNHHSIRFIESKPRANRDGLYRALVVFDLLVFVSLRAGGELRLFQSPLATSFILLMVVGAVVDRWREPERSPVGPWLDFVLFAQFFLFLMAGPLEKGKVFFNELAKELRPTLNEGLNGGLLFALGFGKICLLWPAMDAVTMGMPLDSVFHHVVYGFLLTFKVYLEFSGLCDMGRGLAHAFGVKSSVNFRPYLYATGPADFWLRWNITISAWLRNYVNFPLMLRYGRWLGPDPIILLSFVLMGLWHGLTLVSVAFGLFNGFLVIISSGARFKRLPAIFGRALVLVLMVGSGLILAWGKRDYLLTEQTLQDIVSSNVSPLVAVALVIFFVVEFLQEKSRNTEWFFAYPLWGKGLVFFGLASAFFYGLDAGWLDWKAQSLVPVYFKI